MGNWFPALHSQSWPVQALVQQGSALAGHWLLACRASPSSGAGSCALGHADTHQCSLIRFSVPAPAERVVEAKSLRA